MSNYNPDHEPTDINELILQHIDYVMHEECEKKDTSVEDTWTLKKILSWERFGSTICRTCDANREKLLYQLIQKWKDEYDYTGVIRRGETEYRELPYEIKYFCQRIAIDNVKQDTWTPMSLYEYGRKFYMGEIKMSEVDDLKISNVINERNIEYLIKRFDKFEKQCITKEMLATKKQFPHLNYDY
jgi:hypothetical protein